MLHPITKSLDCQVGWLVSSATGDVLRVGCNRWGCSDCGHLKRAKWVRERCALNPTYKFIKLVTLTLPGVVRELPEQFRMMQRAWRNVYQYLRRHYGSKAFVWVSEIQQRGALHRHVLIDCRYIPQDFLSDLCVSYGLGEVVDIRAVFSRHGVSRYVTKYLTKACARLPRYARRCQSSVRFHRTKSDWSFLSQADYVKAYPVPRVCLTCNARYVAHDSYTECARCARGDRSESEAFTSLDALTKKCVSPRGGLTLLYLATNGDVWGSGPDSS